MKKYFRRVVEFLLHGVRPYDTRANVMLSDAQNRLSGKKILITGGGHGLGFYIAQKCVSEGANVIITGRNEKKLKEASDLLKCSYLVFDVTNFSEIETLFNKCEYLLNGKVNCLVNNAGISLHEGKIENVTIESFDQQIDTNLKAPYFLSKEFIKRYKMSNLDTGSIVFISSERGLYCDDQPYGIIKNGLNCLTQGLGRRYLHDGIRVNAVAPGVTVSDLTQYTRDGNLYRSQSCGKRAFLGEEVAEIVAFLLSDVSSCINSEIIPCNQGNHLRCDW